MVLDSQRKVSGPCGEGHETPTLPGLDKQINHAIVPAATQRPLAVDLKVTPSGSLLPPRMASWFLVRTPAGDPKGRMRAKGQSAGCARYSCC